MAIFNAARAILSQDGVHGFTTTRIAERAGVSVGSIYQYFPNKGLILLYLEQEHTQRSVELARMLLGQQGRTAVERLSVFVRASIASEVEESDVRAALRSALALYRERFDAVASREVDDRPVARIVDEATPRADAEARDLAKRVVMATISSVGRQFAEIERTPAETELFAKGVADMLTSYLAGLSVKSITRRR